MHTSEMMVGVLVVGSVNSSLATPHLGRYITESATRRTPRQTVPIRISVKSHK